MEYHQRLRRATAIKEVQEVYSERFKDMVAEAEEQFIAEERGQQLVYANDCIDPSLTVANIHLLIYAENQVRQLSRNKSEGLMIESDHNSFIAGRLEGLKKGVIVNGEKTRN